MTEQYFHINQTYTPISTVAQRGTHSKPTHTIKTTANQVEKTAVKQILTHFIRYSQLSLINFVIKPA